MIPKKLKESMPMVNPKTPRPLLVASRLDPALMLNAPSTMARKLPAIQTMPTIPNTEEGQSFAEATAANSAATSGDMPRANAHTPSGLCSVLAGGDGAQAPYRSGGARRGAGADALLADAQGLGAIGAGGAQADAIAGLGGDHGLGGAGLGGAGVGGDNGAAGLGAGGGAQGSAGLDQAQAPVAESELGAGLGGPQGSAGLGHSQASAGFGGVGASGSS